MAQAWPAQGTTIAIDEAYPASGTYTLIGEVISIGHAGGGEVGERDTTVLTSSVKTNAPTIPDNGEVSLSTNYDPTDAVHKFVRNLKDSPPGANTNGVFGNNYKVAFNTFNTNSSAVMFGWVKEWDGANADSVDDNLTADITLRISGAVTWAP